DARVIVLHVLPRASYETEVNKTMPCKPDDKQEQRAGHRAEMMQLLERARERASFDNIECLLEEGDVVQCVTRLARQTACELIVMGAHGKSRSNERMGSIASAVTRQASCPVLTVTVPGVVPMSLSA